MVTLPSIHNRYLIYSLLRQYVDIRLPTRFGGKSVQGLVNRVHRDIFENKVVVTINKKRHFFQEPQAIVFKDGNLLFLYGDVGYTDSEEMLEDDYNAYQESIHQHLRRTCKKPVITTVFHLCDRKRNSLLLEQS